MSKLVTKDDVKSSVDQLALIFYLAQPSLYFITASPLSLLRLDYHEKTALFSTNTIDLKR